MKQTVEIIGGHCCDHCNSLDGRTIPMEDAIKNPDILELDKCTREDGCNCWWSSVVMVDKNGRIIFK